MTLFTYRTTPVRLHWSTSVFFLVLLGLALRAPDSQSALWQVLGTLGLLASVLLHELGHVTAAFRLGYAVNAVTIYPFGGIASIQMPFYPKARDEFLLTAAGPAVNWLIAGTIALLTLQQPWEWPKAIGNWHDMLRVLMYGNLVMSAYNLLPAYPMDGGRLLRALLTLCCRAPLATLVANTISLGLLVILAWVMIYLHAYVAAAFLGFLFFHNLNLQPTYLWGWRAANLSLGQLAAYPYRTLHYAENQMAQDLKAECTHLAEQPLVFVVELKPDAQGQVNKEVLGYTLPSAILAADPMTPVLQLLLPTYNVPAQGSTSDYMDTLFHPQVSRLLVVHQDAKVIGVIDREHLNERLRILKSIQPA